MRSIHKSAPGKRLFSSALLLLLLSAAGCKQSPWTLWDSYAARFIDRQGRVIDPQGNQRTTSEGQAYALFFALVDNDRPRFDRVFEWTQDNLAQGDLQWHLPAWLWGQDKDGTWKILDPNSASDADVWLAYTLLEAGRLWHQPGYVSLGRKVMDQIAASEVVDLPAFGSMLLPGPVGFEHDDTWTLNPSYLPAFVFQRFAQVDPYGPWMKIAVGTPRLLKQSSPKGFAMDWVGYRPGDGFFPAPQSPSDSGDLPSGSYDSIRVYLWAGMMDEHDTERAELLDALPAMSSYLARHDLPPERVDAQGDPSGQNGPVGFSAAVLPYLRAIPGSGRAIMKQAIRLQAEKDPSTGLYGKDTTYYDQNLALFGAGFIDGRFRFSPGGELRVRWASP